MLSHTENVPIFILIATALLNTFAFFTTSAILWPYGSIAILLVSVITVGQMIHILLCNDPSPDELIKKRKAGFQPMPYVSNSGHVIQDERCRICLIDAPPKTKHCRVCNVCILGFDHHCVWLNKCVGSKNYKEFMLLVISVCVTTGIVFIYHVSMVALWFCRSPHLAHTMHEEDMMYIELPILTTYFYIWLGISAIISCITIVIFLPVLNLLIFHMRLAKNGQSTYQVLMEHRKQKNATITGTSLQSNFSEVRIIGGRTGAVVPTSTRTVTDVAPPITPRRMETGEESPRYRASRDNIDTTIS